MSYYSLSVSPSMSNLTYMLMFFLFYLQISFNLFFTF